MGLIHVFVVATTNGMCTGVWCHARVAAMGGGVQVGGFAEFWLTMVRLGKTGECHSPVSGNGSFFRVARGLDFSPLYLIATPGPRGRKGNHSRCLS